MKQSLKLIVSIITTTRLLAMLAFLAGLFIMPFTASAATNMLLSSYGATNDATNVYYQYQYTGTWSFYHVFIDTDQSATSGYAFGGIGADYLTENNELYKYSGSGTNWRWTFIKNVTYSNTNSTASWTVARADIGETANPNWADLIFEVEANGGGGTDISPKYTQVYTSGATATPGPTNTPAPPTAPTRTNTSVAPTATSTAGGPTATPVPPTATPTRTSTSVAPTATPTNPPPPTATPAPSGSCTHYVSTTGSDSNAGTLAAPWRTVQKAANTAGPGNVVCVRGGSYGERVTVNVSGSAAGGYITFQSYPGETAILDGTGLTPPSGWSAMIWIQGRSYLIVKGFEIRNYKSTTTGNDPIGIFVTAADDHIEIRNNKVHDMGNYANAKNGTDAHGIAVYGTSAPQSINNVILDGNELYNLVLGSSESMVVNGNVQYWSVTNNKIHDNNNIGIDAIGFEGKSPDVNYDQARDGVIANNLVYNIDSYGNPAYGHQRSADGIYVDGGTRITVERNVVHHTNLGVELASEHAGKSTSYITVRNNFVYSNTQVGIAFGGYDTKRGSTENCVIVNNTLYNNYTQRDWGGELYVQYDTRNNIIKNNVLYANDALLFVYSWSAVMTGNVMDKNLFYSLSGGTNGNWVWKNVTYTTFAAYQQGSGNDANSLIGQDPLFVSTITPDLHLQSSSPAIDQGQNLSEAGSLDIDGQARAQGASIDLGADEVR